jgi:hypothetical protein
MKKKKRFYVIDTIDSSSITDSAVNMLNKDSDATIPVLALMRISSLVRVESAFLRFNCVSRIEACCLASKFQFISRATAIRDGQIVTLLHWQSRSESADGFFLSVRIGKCSKPILGKPSARVLGNFRLDFTDLCK